MSTADYALIISLFSSVVALASFIWNVWSKFIYPKAKLRITLYLVQAFGEGTEGSPKRIRLSITNHGPTDVRLETTTIVVAPEGWRFWRQGTHAIVAPLSGFDAPDATSHPMRSTALPVALPVGASASLYFIRNAHSFVRLKLRRFSVIDNFNRTHSVPHRMLTYVRKQLEEEFEGEPKYSFD